MTFADRERSVRNGAPVGLFEFSRGPLIWRYTNCGADYDARGIVYTNVPGFSDDVISQSGEIERDSLTLTVPASLPVVQHYLSVKPSTRTRLAIRSVHFGDEDPDLEWIGYIAAIRRKRTGERLVTCQSIAATFGRPGLRLCWSRGCPYVVYDNRCTVNPDKFAVSTVLGQVSGIAVNAAALSAAPEDGYYSGGVMRWTSADGVDEVRGLDLHDRTAGTVRVFGGTQGLASGQTVTVMPGCDYTVETCERRFNNRVNCGCHKGMPGKSPFDGTEVF
uniref:DUF2163 domain-containing protein n=1 Tax=Xanthomonas albilineans TaxID=29447 RepID=UPI0027DC32DC|nr:DUF2163 domain-containing protein [Xanthomonas albilineans]